MSHDPIELLEGYVSREGHALVPDAHIERGVCARSVGRQAAARLLRRADRQRSRAPPPHRRRRAPRAVGADPAQAASSGTSPPPSGPTAWMPCELEFWWCRRGDLNPHVLADTSPSSSYRGAVA